MSRRVVIVDDDQSTCEMLDELLRGHGFAPSMFTSVDGAFDYLAQNEVDVVLTDLNLPGTNGIELCKRLAQEREDVPVVVMTAFGSLENAVAAIRAGAYDFVTKPCDTDLLVLTLERATKHRALAERVKILSRRLDESGAWDELIGESTAIRELKAQLSRIAASDVSVLIVGETGSGKELVARSLHSKSRRSAGPFVAVNCAALPDTLLESELFGHKKGAFTDAGAERSGLFLQAAGGTLFLDEIGDMSLDLQPKLLRALEGRTVRPVGGDDERAFDARIVAATNRDLESAIDDGKFREDLYYRINVIEVDVPPLRACGSDVLLIAQKFLQESAARAENPVKGMSKAAAERILDYPWPGNVRELRNAVERAVALTRYDKIGVDDLPRKVRMHTSQNVVVAGEDPNELVSLEEVERRYILHVMKAVGGNRSRAARVLGLDRKTLYRRLRQYKHD